MSDERRGRVMNGTADSQVAIYSLRMAIDGLEAPELTDSLADPEEVRSILDEVLGDLDAAISSVRDLRSMKGEDRG
jgi:hypothetical protein